MLQKLGYSASPYLNFILIGLRNFGLVLLSFIMKITFCSLYIDIQCSMVSLF